MPPPQRFLAMGLPAGEEIPYVSSPPTHTPFPSTLTFPPPCYHWHLLFTHHWLISFGSSLFPLLPSLPGSHPISNASSSWYSMSSSSKVMRGLGGWGMTSMHADVVRVSPKLGLFFEDQNIFLQVSGFSQESPWFAEPEIVIMAGTTEHIYLYLI